MAARKILMIVLVLSAVMPLGAGIMSLVANDMFHEQFHVVRSSGTYPLSIYFGLSALYIAGFSLLAAVWISKGKPEGVVVAQMLGWLTIFGGGMMFLLVSEPGFAAVDFAKGVVITVLAYLARRPRPLAVEAGTPSTADRVPA